MLLIIVFTFTSCNVISNNSSESITTLASNNEANDNNSDIDTYDVNVSISYRIILADKVKGVNPNIIKAARQGLYDYDCNNAKIRKL